MAERFPLYGRFKQIPVSLERPPPKKAKTHPYKPVGQRAMRDVIRKRQNVEADALDLQGIEYDWDGDLRDRWMPGNGTFYPWYDPRWKELLDRAREAERRRDEQGTG